jgi:uncharacterized protein (TIGR02145 family)
MKKKNTYLLFPVALSFLLACSADVGYAPDKDYSGQSPSYNADYLEDLPDCDSKHEGLVVHVDNYRGKDYACSEGYWVALGESNTDKKLPDVNETTDDAVALHEKFKNVESVQILDTRDNKVYKAIVLGDLVWMAENLDYETQYSRTNPECDDFGIKCGRYYMWNDAMYGDDNSSVCLPGMRLPTEDDVEKLVEFIGGVSNGYVLKSKSYWEESDDAPLGTDELGFNAYPAGYKSSSRNYIEYFGTETVFWTGVTYGYNSSLTLSLYSHNSILGTNWSADKDNYMNVRCVGDL